MQNGPKINSPGKRALSAVLIILDYYMAVSHKDRELPNSRIWLKSILTAV